MSSIKGTARVAGLMYLGMGLPAPMNLLYLPDHFMVAKDAAATANNIAAEEFTYRIGILAGLVSLIFFLFLVLTLYRLLRDVDRSQARIMVALVLVSVSIGLVILVFQLAPLIIQHRAASMSGFTKPQLDALSLGFLHLNNAGNLINSSLWGLWLLPFGILVIKSGFIPKFIGYFLIAGCFAYLTNSVTYILWPQYLHTVNNITLPLGGPGELFIMLWLLIKGGKVPLPAA